MAQPLAQAMQAGKAGQTGNGAADTGTANAGDRDRGAAPPGLLLVSAGADRVIVRGQATGAGFGNLLTGSGLLIGKGLPVTGPDTNWTTTTHQGHGGQKGHRGPGGDLRIRSGKASP